MANAVVLNHTATNTITAGNSVSCNNGTQTDDNNYYWAIDLTAYGLGAGFNVTGGSFGVEGATAPTPATTQTVTVNLYDGWSTSGAVLTPGAAFATANVTVANGALFIQNFNITGTATSSKIVMEVFSPLVTNNLFFIGSNTDVENGLDYIQAPACGITTPTSLSSIGFGGMHMVMSLTGTPSTTPEPASMVAMGLGLMAMARRRRKA